jgi:septum site-determining protein MinC
MSADPQHVSSQQPVLELKSSSFTVPLLVLSKYDLHDISEQLALKIQQAPEFFNNSPLIIDLQVLTKEAHEINLESLVKIVREQKLIPVGIRGGNQEQNKLALELGISVQSATNTRMSSFPSSPQKIEPVPVAKKEVDIANDIDEYKTKIITQPVRSGQRVYAQGDLIVLSQVSAGSEILAEGSIHVYSTLRGRALAGVQGNSNSRIFCSDLRAELVSIDGHYKISDDLNDIAPGKPVQLFLKDQHLVIKEI